jgi:hypothetical protein
LIYAITLLFAAMPLSFDADIFDVFITLFIADCAIAAIAPAADADFRFRHFIIIAISPRHAISPLFSLPFYF